MIATPKAQQIMLPQAFAERLKDHRHRYNLTGDCEARAVRLRSSCFPPRATGDFVREVSQWARYAGMGQRIVTQNRGKLTKAFREANDLLSRNDVIGALKRLNELRQLGGVSFASKHLRFLAPDRAVVLDSVLERGLGYAMNAAGYRRFLDHCHELAAQLDACGVNDPCRHDGKWLIADVEGALFMHFRNREQIDRHAK